MKRFFKNIGSDMVFKVIGYAMVFTCWVLPLVLVTNGNDDYSILIMMVQILIGGFLLITGYTISKRKASDSSYKTPVFIFRVFKLWQLFLMASGICFCIGLAVDYYENEDAGSFLYALMFVFLLASPISAAIPYFALKVKKRIHIKELYVDVGGGKYVYESSYIKKCAGCGKKMLEDDMKIYDSKEYCAECYDKAIKEREERLFRERNTFCSDCQRLFPRSTLFAVNGLLLCEECMQKKYKPDL